MNRILDLAGAPVFWALRRTKPILIAFYAATVAVLLSCAMAAVHWSTSIDESTRNTLTVAAVALAVYAQWALYHYVIRSRAQGETLLEHAARGEWNFDRVPIDEPWRQSGTMPLVNRVGKQVSKLIVDIGHSSEQVLGGACSVSASSKALARRAEEIASMLEETASGMEEFAATIERNAANCSDAKSRAQAAAQAAVAAGEQSARLMTALEGAVEKSRRVSDILSLIEDIANQTNMLALSASIEAARAGEHGRGFALVANEVRDLSRRSANSSKVVRERIEATGRQTRESLRIASATQESMREIESRVATAQQLLDSISLASSEQNTGIAQVRMAIEHMAMLTQNNAAMVDYTAHCAEDMERGARQIDVRLDQLQSNRYVNQQQCVAIVRRAVAHVQSVGVQRAAHDFMGYDPRFRADDMFCVLTRMDSTVLAHGGEPAFVGRCGDDLQDANGFYYSREITRVASQKGNGWLSYRVANPRTGKNSDKLSYFERVQGHDAIVICGTFKRIDAHM